MVRAWLHGAHSPQRRRAWACLALLLGAGSASAQADDDAAARYASHAQISEVSLSPDGKRLAMLVVGPQGKRIAVVRDVPLVTPGRVIANFSDVNVTSLAWVNNERLVYEAFQPEALVDQGGAGAIAIDHDGGNARNLIVWRDRFIEMSGGNRSLPYGWELVSPVQDGSADVWVAEVRRRGEGYGDFIESRLARLNTKTGRLDNVSLGAPSYTVRMVVDARQQPRVALRMHEGRFSLHLRAADGSWSRIEDHAANSPEALWPIALENDHQLVVRTHAGQDTAGLYIYDLRTRKLDREPLVRARQYDIGSLVVDSVTKQVLGARLVSDQLQSVWFDERMLAIQKAIDAALPAGRSNYIHCGACQGRSRFVVWSGSDRMPGEYLLYDHEAKTLSRIDFTHPWHDEQAQGTRQFTWIDSRDGLRLPLVMTHPHNQPGKAALPAVVLVHGGPWVRGGSRLWSSEAQFLASKGWRVLEVEFRGSTGFGDKHFQAGRKQWGRAMQDDLADAVAWAAKEGWIDPKRVCIAGSSYGGYAALMGPVRHPQTYRCAVSHVGVTDLRLMFTSGWTDLNQESRRYTWKELVGDLDADRAMLRENSPTERVADIKVPVLLVQGWLDRRVPREHADRFEAAARRAGVAVERINYHDEGHGFIKSRNEADYLRRMEAFMARSVGLGDQR